MNFGPVACFFFWKVVEPVFMGSLLWVDVMRMMNNGDGCYDEDGNEGDGCCGFLMEVYSQPSPE